MKNNIALIQTGNKSNNLEKLKHLSKKIFIIPNFITATDISQIQTLPGCQKVAVRSDSIYEDGETESGSGAFESILNVPNTIEDIKKAYQLIQTHAQNKIGCHIGVIIQEMVEDPNYAGVVFSRDIREDNPDYFTINYTDGLGNKVVDGNHKTTTKLIHKDHNPTQEFEKKLTQITQDIIKEYGDNIDIEFAYKDNTIYILQVRRLTAVNNSRIHIKNQSIKQLIEAITQNYSNKFLGDMIDINAAELLGGSRSQLINSFFSYIFPENALVKGREELGYSKAKNMSSMILNKLYIDLEENIVTFLPKTLNDKEKKIFQDYFKELLYKNPSYQDKLDTVHYPISNKQTNYILNQIDIGDKEKKEILEKFNIFFQQLEAKLKYMVESYFSFEQELIQQHFAGAKGIADIHEYIPDIGIDELLKNIIQLAKEFTKYVRGAFYFRNQDIQTGEAYKYYRYTNQLEIAAYKKTQPITINLSNGFDMLNIQSNTFSENTHTKKEKPSNYSGTQREIFEIARENIKYMMMLYITALGKKINKEPIPNIYDADFKDIMKHNGNIKKLKEKIKVREIELAKNLLLPSCIYRDNHAGIFEILDNGGIYFPFNQKQTTGETVFIDNIHDIDYNEIEKMTKNKIILITNATPEIDSYLPYLRKAKCIITKFGGPGAHIVLRIREINYENEKKISLVIGTGDLFESIKKHKTLDIDFIREKIQGL